jgi:glycosyltransferase involved in cell wall biosynthesis
LKVLHVITGLGDGGAEGMLYRLCLKDRITKHFVISMSDAGKYGQLLRDAGIEVYYLNIYSISKLAKGLIKLWLLIRKVQPDVVQTWLYHADFFAGIIAKLLGKKIVWSIRNGNISSLCLGYRTAMLVRLCALLSKFIPKKILSCSNRAAEVHCGIGFDRLKISIIYNGFCTTKFFPNLVARQSIRAALGISECVFVIGCVARFDIQKDHKTLLASLNLLKKKENFICLLIGFGVDNKNLELNSLIKNYDLAKQVFLLGPRDDIPNLMNVMDVHILSSRGEGFPNSIGEAMACGTPCIVTDVGDAAYIVDSTGWVAPSGEPLALAEFLAQAKDEMYNYPEKWSIRKDLCRLRISQNFSLEMTVKRYNELWNSL